jgi:hypothetical protein
MEISKKFDKLFQSPNDKQVFFDERQTLTPEEEQTLQLFFQLTSDTDLQTAIEAKNNGEFSQLAMLYSITQFYDQRKYVTKKQYQQLRKHILTKNLKLQADENLK